MCDNFYRLYDDLTFLCFAKCGYHTYLDFLFEQLVFKQLVTNTGAPFGFKKGRIFSPNQCSNIWIAKPLPLEYHSLFPEQHSITVLIFLSFAKSLTTIMMLQFPDSKVHGTNMGPTWVLPAQMGPMLAPWTLLSGTHRGYQSSVTALSPKMTLNIVDMTASNVASDWRAYASPDLICVLRKTSQCSGNVHHMLFFCQILFSIFWYISNKKSAMNSNHNNLLYWKQQWRQKLWSTKTISRA